MINFLSNWIEGIVIAVIIASILEMLLPNGSLKKYIKLVLGIYVIFSIISPFVDRKELYSFDISDTIDEYSANITPSSSSNRDSNLEKMYLDSLEKEIVKKVEEQGYTTRACTAKAIFDTNNENFGIKKISIILKSKKSNYKKDNEKQNNSEISNIENVNKVEVNIGNTNAENDDEGSSITDKDIAGLKRTLSDYYDIDKNIIEIQK